ncbi:putative protein tyrosine/serine/threonine phosphatase activity [Lyophyllum shimeji]|uniref:Tyrosine specific protein phosphatases domain-containing protein n=1 Tax=Lyophyllum shimeji TaxID=47721 RepID=A0A9P3PJA2_LYOSH|nr:putative protein tyrosine/serine/threonine phosphatase activity [Lyophyllum shimeji]
MATLVQAVVPHPFLEPRDPPHVPPAPLPSPLELSIEQLAPLASQHHSSEYNRLKFGLQGCPIRYLPLSMHLPDFFRELQQRQVQSAKERSWWPCDGVPPSTLSPVILGSRGALPQDSETVHLQEEIEAAIAEPLDHTPRHAAPPLTESPNHSIKTSSTHPINISPMIPHELIPLISSHLLFNSSPTPSPTVFEVPPSFTLGRLLATLSTHRHTRAPTCPAPTPTVGPQLVVRHLRTRSKVTEALQAAINGSLSAVHPSISVRKNKQSPSMIPPSPFHIPRAASADALPSDKTLKINQSNTSSISLSLSLTIADTDPTSLNIGHKQISEPNPAPSDLNILATTRAQTEDDGGTSLLIGNLLLSSCPGKKVRLQGPVKGRSGVCRDLDTDLRRMKDLSVGCIICCLDDSELEFLGAPWIEYERLAKLNGIDVLRVPTPEGLAPLSPASLDAELTKVINAYTLRGIPVLVHCRGGVGRAGVIACCWLIRLGLCGWVEGDYFPPSASPDEKLSSGIQPAAPSNGGPRKNTVQFVEHVISVVRRRRSLKAVETYEQVQFLVDFVEYLRGSAGRGRS